MSDKVYYKGRFIKQKVLNKRLKAVAATAEAKKRQTKGWYLKKKNWHTWFFIRIITINS